MTTFLCDEVELPEGANPVELYEEIEDVENVDTFRNGHCVVYSKCLDWVVEQDPWWVSFSCRQCPLWSKKEGE